ncbi:MAG: DUF642 domain-containing protein [Phycisphaerales bacterium]|nr:DUF642 domain-containing protein [Phycisphaerales bacterium]
MRLIFPAVLSLFATTAASAQLVNGSFENEDLVNPSRVAISNLTDWTASGGLTLLERGVNGTSNIAAHTGSQFVSFGHNGNSGDTLSQSIATTAGQNYSVSFYLHCIQGAEFQTITASALAGGDTLATINASASSPTQGWLEFSYNFQAVSGSTEIRFVHSLGAGSANIAIDTVTVIPAPGALALLAAGGLIATRRRRSN